MHLTPYAHCSTVQHESKLHTSRDGLNQMKRQLFGLFLSMFALLLMASIGVQAQVTWASSCAITSNATPFYYSFPGTASCYFASTHTITITNTGTAAVGVSYSARYRLWVDGDNDNVDIGIDQDTIALIGGQDYHTIAPSGRLSGTVSEIQGPKTIKATTILQNTGVVPFVNYDTNDSEHFDVYML